MATIGTPARPIGDKERTRRLAFGLSVGIDDARLELQSLWEGYGNIAGPLVQAGTPLRRIARRLGVVAEAAKGPMLPQSRQFVGLKHLIEVAHDQAPVAYAQSQIEIAIPFGQVAILSDQSVIGLDPLERALTDALQAEFGSFLDPRQPPRVRFLHAQQLGAAAGDQRHLRIYIGNGIFVPPGQLSRRTQAGHLWLRRPGESTVYVARLPDGSEAAFHDGQTGLAFSGSVRLTPASCREVLFTEADNFGSVFFVGRQRETMGVTFQAWQTGDEAEGRERVRYQLTLPDHNHEELQGAAVLEPYVWYGVRRFSGDGRAIRRDIAFEFCFAPDSARPGRLWRQRPPGPHLEVTGFTMPDPQRTEGVARVWIDFDAEGFLVADALTARLRSLVVGPSGLVGIFDRDGGTYSERGLPTGQQPVVNIGGRQLRVSEFQGLPAGRLMIETVGSAAFGYIALPPRLEAPRGFHVGPSPSIQDGDRACDWLNAAGLVEMKDEAVESGPPGEGIVQPQAFPGLAVWQQSLGLAPGFLQWDPAGNLRVGRDVGGTQAVVPGADVLLGPLRVRYVPGS